MAGGPKPAPWLSSLLSKPAPWPAESAYTYAYYMALRHVHTPRAHMAVHVYGLSTAACI